MITSPQNDRIKYIRALQSQSRIRRKEGRIALEGVRLIGDALMAGCVPEYVVYSPDAIATGKPGEALYRELLKHNVLCLDAAPEVIAHAADTQTPQGILAVLPIPEPAIPPHRSLIVILDAVADPGNLGTILRTSAAAGADVVCLAPGCVDPYNPKALRSGMGAHFRIPVVQQAWAEIAALVGDVPVYVADANGTHIYTAVDWTQPAAIIIGGEARGADASARQLASALIAIPMANQFESLNAAMAAAVLLFEVRRQRIGSAE